MATAANIYLDSGSDYSSIVTIRDSNDDIVNLTNYTVKAQMKRSSAARATYHFVASVYNAAEGKVLLQFSALRTAAIPEGIYVYDVLLIATNGTKIRVLQGNVSVTKDVTYIPPEDLTVTFDDEDIILAPGSDAGSLTGTTLASNVINSSLTSVGTLVDLTVTNPIEGSLAGNASTASRLLNSVTINGVAFNGSTNITIPGGSGGDTLTFGYGLNDGSYNGTGADTISIDTDVILTVNDTQIVSNKKLESDSVYIIDGVDSTKELKFILDNIETETTVEWGVQSSSGTVAYLDNNLSEFANDGLTLNGQLKVGGNNIIGYGNIGEEGLPFGHGFFNDLTVTNDIIGSISGNADTATQLLNAITINGVSFNGSENITIPGGSLDESLIIGTGLTGSSFNGSSEVTIGIDTEYVVTLDDNQSITNKELVDGSVSFVSGSDSSKKLRTSLSDLSTDTTVTWTVQNSNGTVAYLENNLSEFANDGLTLNGQLKVGTNNILGIGDIGSDSFRFNAGYFNTLYIGEDINGDITGNSETTTRLLNARTINGVSFDGSENITIPGGEGGEILTFGTGLIDGTYDGTAPATIDIDTTVIVTLDGAQTLTDKTLTNPNISALTSTDTFFTFNLAATTPGFSGGFVFNQGEDQSASITNAIYEDIGQANFALIRPSTGVDSFVEFLAVGLGSVQFTQTGSSTSNCKILTRDFEGAYYTNAQFDSENNTFFQNLLLKNETQNTIRLNSIVANEGAKEAGDIEFYSDNTGRSITTFFVQNPSRIPMLSFDSTGVYTYNNLNLTNSASNTVSIISNVFTDSQAFDAGRIEFFYLNDNVYRSQTRFYTRNANNVEELTAFFDYHGLNLQNRSIREAFLISSQVKFAVNYLGAETAEFDLSLISADTHRTYTLPDQNGTIALTSDIESPLFQQETLSGTTDDENTIFTLSQTPKTNSQLIFKNGLFQTLVNDYTLSEVTVTFVVPPKVGDQLTAVYQY